MQLCVVGGGSGIAIELHVSSHECSVIMEDEPTDGCTWDDDVSAVSRGFAWVRYEGYHWWGRDHC